MADTPKDPDNKLDGAETAPGPDHAVPTDQAPQAGFGGFNRQPGQGRFGGPAGVSGGQGAAAGGAGMAGATSIRGTRVSHSRSRAHNLRART